MKKILINATQSEERRVAIVDMATQYLSDLLIERDNYKTKTGNIYIGIITAIEDSLDACFVNFGSEQRHGFLPFKEISPLYYGLSTEKGKPERIAIKDSLKEGQIIMVQVEKEERGNKGAALTTFISLPGSYLVLMPNNPRAGGISRQVEGIERQELRDILTQLSLPEDMGLIIRTAGVGKTTKVLQFDLDLLLKVWNIIKKSSSLDSPSLIKAPFLIYENGDIVIRFIRDHLFEDVVSIEIDDEEVFKRAKNYLQQIRPDFISKLIFYNQSIPLFHQYKIESQIEETHNRVIRLASGGSIVIDYTEALVAIDVNSGQATKGKDIHQTALEINKEAAAAIARQLRLRDIGGLIVIDFIDMQSPVSRREVEEILRQALKSDKARTQVGKISQFGLLEMSRQRLINTTLNRIICPYCEGWGSIRSIESLSLSILRIVEEYALCPQTIQIQVYVPVEIATFMMNEKRALITYIELNRAVKIVIIPTKQLEIPQYRIKRLTESDTTQGGKGNHKRASEISEQIQTYVKSSSNQPQKTETKPAVITLFSEANNANLLTKKTEVSTAGIGILKKIISLFGSDSNKTPMNEEKNNCGHKSNSDDENKNHENKNHESNHTFNSKEITPKQLTPIRNKNQNTSHGRRKITNNKNSTINTEQSKTQTTQPIIQPPQVQQKSKKNIPENVPSPTTNVVNLPNVANANLNTNHKKTPHYSNPNTKNTLGKRKSTKTASIASRPNNPRVMNQPMTQHPVNSLTDVELENFYADTLKFHSNNQISNVDNTVSGAKSAKPEPKSNPVAKKTHSESSSTHTNLQAKKTLSKSASTHLNTTEPNISVPLTEAVPATAAPGIEKNPTVADKYWMPHKIASACEVETAKILSTKTQTKEEEKE